ncbi:hypothetical protein M3J09_008477 [Ascochyta lentis]
MNILQSVQNPIREDVVCRKKKCVQRNLERLHNGRIVNAQVLELEWISDRQTR